MGWKGQLVQAALAVVRPVAVAAASTKRKNESLAPPTTRAEFLSRIPRAHDVLEIGPFHRPVLKGPGVYYSDVLSTEELVARAIALNLDHSACPEIHFVTVAGDLSDIGRRFGAVFSSHCVEHQPDFIEHLRQVEGLLVPGGSYFLIVPDKRYGFDHFQAESHLGDLCEAMIEGRRHHSAASIMSTRLVLTHNDALKHWVGLHGSRPRPSAGEMQQALDESQNAIGGDYFDAHAWYITPSSFRQIVERLQMLGLITLNIECVHDTAVGDQEFFAVLTKPS